MLAYVSLQAVVSGSFERIHNLANLMASLNKYRPSLVIALVDSLMESILTGLQHPLMHAPQACVAQTQFLAELYNFAVIKTAHLFSVLYMFVTHGAPHSCRPVHCCSDCGRQTALQSPTSYNL